MKYIVGLKELRQNIQKYTLEVKKGKSLIIVRRSKPLFKITPLEDEWEQVVDFTKVRKGDIPVKELLFRF